MAKLTLGAAPKNFKRIIKVPTILDDGTEGIAELEMSFIYRNRQQYAKLMDEVLAKVKKEVAKEKENEKEGKQDDKTLVDTVKESNAESVDFILKIADGWELEDEFNKANILTLLERHPESGAAIGIEYRKALMEVREKN